MIPSRGAKIARRRFYHEMSNEGLFKALFLYIQKNKLIPDFISQIDPDNVKAQTLLNAIQRGDPHDPILTDAECYLYLLYLIKTSQIPFWQGMTVYAYLTALVQFTDQQPINEKDKATQSLRKIKIDFLSKKERLTPEGETFLKQMHSQFSDAGYTLSYEDLKLFILDLPPSEQWLIKIPYTIPHFQEQISDIDSLFHVLLKNVPFFCQRADEDGVYGWIPSFSLINDLFERISPEPIQMMSIFGSIGYETLRKLHEKNIHPISLYGQHVKSNSVVADSYHCGCFLMLIHDIGHAFWGTLLSPEQRKLIFHHFIPQMESFMKIAEEHQDHALMKFIQTAIIDANDFDLTNIKHFLHPDERIYLYLSRTLGVDNHTLFPVSRSSYANLGQTCEDRIFFLLLKLTHELEPGPLKEFWAKIAKSIETGLYGRHEEIATAIHKLAEAAANRSKNKSSSALSLGGKDCEAWLHRIEPSRTSAEIWKMIDEEDFNDQFLDLVSQGHLMFFYPYLPLSDEVRGAFKVCLEERCRELNKPEEPSIGLRRR